MTLSTPPRRMLRPALLLFLVLGASTAGAETYRVGPGRAYQSLQSVAGLLRPGDVVEVDGNVTYPGDVTFTRPGTAADPIVIKGLLVGGNRPVISGGTNTVHFRTDVIGSGADHYVMEGFEITGGSSRCVFHQSDDVTLRDLVVHDCPSHGILGADWGAGSLTVEHSEVYRCGAGDTRHQIYASADQDNYPDSVFRLRYSYVHDANGGNNVKSRAARNEIYYNRIEGAYYHELELIGSECCSEGLVREDGDVVGNLLVKKGSNSGFSVLRFGGDGTGQSWGRYRFVNNTVIVAGTGAVFRLFDGLESVEMHNNVFYRGGGPVTLTRTVEAVWASGERFAGSNNWIVAGSTSVPVAWTGTVTGTNPGFTNAAGGDYSPAAGSPLLNAGSDVLSGPAGSPFHDPLFPPGYHPPGAPGAFGTANPRPADGQLDIGAYERGALGSPEISISDVSVTEGTGNAVFTVTLSRSAATAVTVGYTTSNGIATAGSDYQAATGTVSFAAGETSKTASVAVLGDTVDESDETFYVTLSNPLNATIADGQATVTILDDDIPTLTLAVGDVSVAEGNAGSTNAVVTVTLSGAPAQTVTANYATANGTAIAGSDYAPQAGTLSFSPGQISKTITVAVNGDTAVETDETLVVDLANASGATILDGQGQITLTNDDVSAIALSTWTPPVGIPAPSFGIAQEAADSSYTHWVDNSGSCSDSGNGTPAAPRCTIPTSLPAGATVQVRGGPYSFTSDRTWSAAGSLASPVFVRGPATPATRPVMQFGDGNRLTLSGTYLIVENLEMKSGAVNITSTSHHVAVRHFYLHDNPSGPGSFLGNSGDDVVIYDCEIAYNGQIPSEPDDHGIQTFAGTRNVWIVDNHIHDNSGDAIQFCHGCIGGGNGPANIYIGRNRLHDDEENGIDIKETLGPVVISENELYGYEPGTFSGNGDALRLNDEGNQGEIWILNNRVHDSTICINPSRSMASSYILGNRLWNCASNAISDPGNSTIVANNTVVSSPRGIVGGTEVRGNIVSESTTCALCSDVSGCSNNLVWRTGGTPVVQVSCSNNVQANPLMLTNGGEQTGLQASSPAVNAGFAHSAYAYFQSTYGLDIRRDPGGTVRPTGAAWDIGAFELASGSGGPTIAINDVAVTEGNSGTTNAVLTVTLSSAGTSTVTVSFATANGSASAGSDYVAQSGTLSFSAGQTSRTIAVVVNGDTAVEPNETILVNLSSPSGATISDGQGQATITNDDTAPTPGTAPVVWTALVGVSASGNSLTKTTGNAIDSGAVSVQQIASGDGYVQITASETNTYRMFGLSNGNTDVSYQDIDFGLDLAPGTMYVFEKGVNKGSFGAYAPGDVLRVAVAGGVVRYSRNGTVFYTSTQTPTYPLLVDSWLYHLGATLNNAIISSGQ